MPSKPKPCAAPDCPSQAWKAGWCRRHHAIADRAVQAGEFEPEEERPGVTIDLTGADTGSLTLGTDGELSLSSRSPPQQESPHPDNEPEPASADVILWLAQQYHRAPSIATLAMLRLAVA